MSKKLLYILVFSLFQASAIATPSPPPSSIDDTPIRLASASTDKNNHTLTRKITRRLTTLRPLFTLALVTIVGRYLWSLSPQQQPSDPTAQQSIAPFSVEHLETLEEANVTKDIPDLELTQATLLGKLDGANKRTISCVMDEEFLAKWPDLQPQLTRPQTNVHLHLSFAPHFLENLTTQINCEKILPTYDTYATAINALETSEQNLAQLKNHLNDLDTFARQKLDEENLQSSCPHTAYLNKVKTLKKELWTDVITAQTSARQARSYLDSLAQDFLDPCTAVYSPPQSLTNVELKFKNIHNILQHLTGIFHHTTLILTPHDLGVTPPTTPLQNYTFMKPGYEAQAFSRLPFFLECFQYRSLWRLQLKSLPDRFCPITERDLQTLLDTLKPLYCDIKNFHPVFIDGFTSAMLDLYKPVFHYLWRYTSPFWTPSTHLSKFSPFLNNTAEKIFDYVAAVNRADPNIENYKNHLYIVIANNIDISGLNEEQKRILIAALDTEKENGFINALIPPTTPTFRSRFSALKTALREMPREILHPNITNPQCRFLHLGLTANLDDIYRFLTFRQIEMKYDLNFEYLPITDPNGAPIVNFISHSLQEFINYLRSASTLEKLTIDFNLSITHLATNPTKLLYLHTHIQMFMGAFLSGLFNVKSHFKALEIANLPLMCGAVSHNNNEIVKFETIWSDTLRSFLSPNVCPAQLEKVILTPRFIDVARLKSALDSDNFNTVMRAMGILHGIPKSSLNTLDVQTTATIAINTIVEDLESPLLTICHPPENSLYPFEFAPNNDVHQDIFIHV